MNNNTEIVNRLLDLISEKGLLPTPLVKKLGLAQGTINQLRKAKNIEKNIQLRSLYEFLGANRDFILTGKGPRFVKEVQEPQINYTDQALEIEYLKKLLKAQEEIIEILKEKLKDTESKEIAEPKRKQI